MSEREGVTPRDGGRSRFGWRDIVRVWSSAADGRRLRKPSDVLLLAVALLLLALLALVAPGPTAVDSAVASVLQALPGFTVVFWGLCYTLLTLWALVLLLAPLFFRRRRRLTLDFLLGGVLALLGSLAAGALAGTSTSETLSALVEAPSDPVYVAVRLAVATAVIVVASPHVSRPLRYWGRLLIVLGAVAIVGLEAAWPMGAVAGVLIGYAAAAVTHLLLGSPQGLLTAVQVDIALADLGVDADDVVPVDDQEAGEALWRATGTDGSSLLVKVYGRDAWDTQVVGSVWTALTRRGEVPRLGRSRESRVEHEALAMLVAERAGASTLGLVEAGRSEQGDALVVTGAPRSSLAAADEVPTDEQLDSWWRSLLCVHATRMAHGRIDRHRLVIREDGTAALADFAAAQFHADEGDRLVDSARLLVATSLAAGTKRALDSAVRVVGTDGLVVLLPYLQPAALGRGTRRAVAAAEWELDDLRTAAIDRLGVEPPPLQQLRRVTPKSIVIVALVAIMAYVLVSMFAGVDMQSVVEALSTANMAILLVALALSPTIQVGFAFSTIGATLVRLRFVPVLMLQYAISFIALCLPSTAARLALEIRFLQKFGVSPTPAVAMGMIDSFSGFLVQVSLIVVILVSGLPGFTTPVFSGSSTTSSTTDDSGRSTLGVVVAFFVIALVVTLLVPRLRHRLLGNIPRIRSRIGEQRAKAGDALLVVRHPRKVATMLLGNLGAQVIQAIILGITLAAFGESASLSQLILINTAVSLFNGLMPVPGGMGVAEAGYTAGLQAIGVPAPVAVSVAIAFRLVTFYLPPIWGSVAMRWLRRHDYV